MVVLPEPQRVLPAAAACPRGNHGEPKTHPETHGKTRCEKGGPKGGQREAKRRQKGLQNEAGRVSWTSFGQNYAEKSGFVILAPLCSETSTFEGLRRPSWSHLGSKMPPRGYKTPLGNEMGKRCEKVRKLLPKGTQNESQNRPKFVQNRTGSLQGGAGGRQAGPERQKRSSRVSPVRIFHQN